MISLKFSLILPTLNREKFIEECLNSIQNQIFKNFEVVVIDQSDNNYTEKVVKSFQKTLNIIYKKVNFKGLSKARNLALKYCSGEYIALLDDDARYSKEYLALANKILDKYKNKKLILSGKIIDDVLSEDFIDYSKVSNGEIFDDKRIFKVCLSAGLIINKSKLIEIDGFDERFGVGAFFGAAEESDMILRLISEGYKIIYVERMKLYHLKPKLDISDNYYMKSYSYALGGGALFKKHIIYRKNIKLVYRYIRSLIVPTIKLILNLFNRDIRKNYKYILKGHVVGFIKFKEL